MDLTTGMDTEPTTQSNSPDSDLLVRRGTLSSIYTSTTSSSPDFTADTAITPEIWSDGEQPTSSVALKVEELDEQALDDIDEVKPSIAGVTLPVPRKRGRPRKHPIVDQKKSAHARSKTGCGTCSESRMDVIPGGALANICTIRETKEEV